nr:hypothetical protein [Streptomyces sp. CBMA29]
MRGALRLIWRTVRGEWQGIVVAPVRELLRRGLPGLSLAFLAGLGVIFFHGIAQSSAGATVVRVAGGVYADLPLPLALLRTPVSLYVPALDLPVWAGMTQLFLAFALAELVLGRARTLVIAYTTTLVGTLMARAMIAMGTGWWGLGLPHDAGAILDTGPSAAVVGLFTYLAITQRAPIVFFFTGGSMVMESVIKPNLAGREHLIAIATAIVLAVVHRRHALSASRVIRRSVAEDRPHRLDDRPPRAEDRPRRLDDRLRRAEDRPRRAEENRDLPGAPAP